MQSYGAGYDSTESVYMSDRPGAPEKLEITQFDQFSTSLAWKKPSTDGGNTILGYQVGQE